MKAAILHLSDIHIDETNSDWLLNKAKQITSAVWNDFSGCKKIIIAVSGDIVYSGKQEQYAKAKQFFRAILRQFAERNLNGIELENRIICVPGNHDCNFDKDTGARKMLLSTLRSNRDAVDGSVYDVISSIQDEYRDFARDIMLNKELKVKLNENIKIEVGDKTILFRLFNTAWMSILKEEQNSIVMPIEMIDDNSFEADLVISLFHHYYSWMSPSIDDNRNRFRNHVMKTSNMVLYGHEHTPAASQVNDNFEEESINEFEGGALYSSSPGTPKESSFNSLIIDFNSYECTVRSFKYENGLYYRKKEESISLNQERKMDEFRHDPLFLKSLKKMSIPVHNSENQKMTLDDFFVYPDLERMNSRQIKVDEDFIDSSSIIDNKDFHLVLLEGDDQCGKTSLLNMYYLQFVERYMYPVLISGKSLESINVDKVIEKSFNEQYITEDVERYSQFDKNRKVLLIDNFDECKLNGSSKKNIINQLLERFAKVIITTKECENISSYFLMEKKHTFTARIKPLGHVKRNVLVKRFYSSYDVNVSTLQKETLLEQVKMGFDMVENFLGKEYIPSYPIYILSILLSNTKMQSSVLEQTSYGYCYEALITCALMTCIKDKTIIDRYYNVLTNLAYFIYKNEGKAISESEFESFYSDYQRTYFAQGFKEVKSNLQKCNLIRCTDEYYYKFSYNYIYYFLVAKYMADNIHSNDGQNDVLDLCINIHDEEKANIIIFITHHIKSPQFIDATLLALNSALESQKPASLDKNDEYYKLLSDICESLKKEIVAPDEEIDPEKEREDILQKRDKTERLVQDRKVDSTDLPVEILNMNKSLRSIEVVGQIVKNRQGSLPKPNIKAMVTEMYEAAFRTISYFGTIIESSRNQVIEDVLNNKKEGESNDEIKKKIDSFFELSSLNFCLFIFSKIIQSVGSKELRATFTEIANELGTPAAKLVSFSIISCFSKIAIPDIQKIVDDLKDNPVAMSIIRARVRSYLYNNHVSFSDRQKIINAVNLNPRDSYITTNRGQLTRKR